MRRTQIYITDAQERQIARAAEERGSSKAAVIREIIDRAFDNGDPERQDLAIIRATSGICADYPDWPEWLESVRGRSADERLRALGL